VNFLNERSKAVTMLIYFYRLVYLPRVPIILTMIWKCSLKYKFISDIFFFFLEHSVWKTFEVGCECCLMLT